MGAAVILAVVSCEVFGKLYVTDKKQESTWEKVYFITINTRRPSYIECGANCNAFYFEEDTNKWEMALDDDTAGSSVLRYI